MKFQKNKSSSLFQFSEETIASTKTNDTSAESPRFQLLFDTLKVGVALSGGRHFQGVKLKLRSRAFCWWIVCYSTSIEFFQILNSNIFRN